MARKARNLMSNSYVHITQQCESQLFLFEEEKYRKHYLGLLKETALKFGLIVLAYCIMKNHIHLLVKVGEDAAKISRAMHWLSGKMAQDYNRAANRKGHFWRDRFASTHICSGKHFGNVISYIDANSLNCKDGCDPIRWSYCSYRELQRGYDAVSVVDRFALIKALKMNDINEFLAWQRKLMDRQTGHASRAAAAQSVEFSGHYALGTQEELNLLRKRLKKRGIFSYMQYLGLDADRDPLWALDLCTEQYAIQRERRLAQQPAPPAA